MYTSRRRFGRFGNIVGTGPGLPASLKGKSFVARREFVYSWRSRSSDQDIKSDGSDETFGVPNPRTNGGIFDIVKERTRFVDELGQVAMAPLSRGATAIYPRCDSGHNFTSVKFYSYPGVFKFRDLYNAKASYDIAWLPSIGFAPMLQRRATPYVTTSSFGQIGTIQGPFNDPTDVLVQGRLNSAFADMVPNSNLIKLGETIASFLTGDIPHLMRRIPGTVKSLQGLANGSLAKDIARFKDAGGSNFKVMKDLGKVPIKELGGEYVAMQFAWSPLIKDVIDTIRILILVDNYIYSENYRRSRRIVFDKQFASQNLKQAYVANGVIGGWPNSAGVTGVGLSNATVSTDATLTQSIMLNARMTPYARPNSASNSFIGQAEEYIQKLGVWYPALGWDLIPYSWLLDWVVNLGNGLTNAHYFGNREGQFNLDYAWATMRSTVESRVTSGSFDDVTASRYFRSGDGAPQSISQCVTRFQGTPFGFGLDYDGLSSFQKSILIALGLARMR